jgi:hypothetical protein
MSASLVVTAVLSLGIIRLPVEEKFLFPATLVTTVAISIAAWLTCTMLTKPTDMDRLCGFYRRVRPSGLWGPVRRKLAEDGLLPDGNGMRRFGPLEVAAWFSGLALVYGTTFGIGKFIFGSYLEGSLYFLLALGGGAVVAFAAKKFFSHGRYIERVPDADATEMD